jgi:hypothetical protein
MNRTVLAALLVSTVGCGSQDGGESVGQTDEAMSSHRVESVTTISYAPNSFVIGNAYPGWHDDVQGNAQFSRGPGNPNGVSYRWGYLFGEAFDHCAWIADAAAKGTGHTPGSRCGTPQQIDTPYFFATYTNGEHNDNAGDGSVTHMHYSGSGCVDHGGYGNVHPWRVPAMPANARGTVPDGRELRWRYVSRDGDWVLVRDPGVHSSTEPNWYFVQRGCVSLANRN